jgi:Ala-tRNA(Pro) deacylase
VPPLGQAYQMETYLDDALGSLSSVYFESGDHAHLVRVNAETFAELMRGVRHGHFGR